MNGFKPFISTRSGSTLNNTKQSFLSKIWPSNSFKPVSFNLVSQTKSMITKGQLISKCLLVSSILPKNEQKNSTLLLWYLTGAIVELSSFVF